jgi:hypothetical protein
LDVCKTALVLLKGEQNINSPYVESEQHAASYALQPFAILPSPPVPLPPETTMHSITPGKGAASEPCAIELCLKPLRLPSLYKEPPDEPGGVGFGPVHTAGNVGMGIIKHIVVNTHELGGASLDMNGTPAPTEGTASVKLADGAVKTTTA